MTKPREFQGTDGRFYWLSDYLGRYIISRSRQECYEDIEIPLGSAEWEEAKEFYDPDNDGAAKYRFEVEVFSRKITFETDADGAMMEPVKNHTHGGEYIRSLVKRYGKEKVKYTYSEINT